MNVQYVMFKEFCEICGICPTTGRKAIAKKKVNFQKCQDGKLHYYKIPLAEVLQYKTVNEVVAESIEIENKTTEMLMEETIVLSVLFTPENTSDKTIEWSSDNEDIAVVSDDGTLEAVGVGSTTITAVHKEFMDSFDIEVKPIEADKVEIEYPIDAESEESAPRVKKGETMQLTAIITPDNTTY